MRALLVTPVISLVACSPPPPTDNAAMPVASVGGRTPSGMEATPAPVASEIPALQPFTFGEASEGRLLGTGCSFLPRGGDRPLLAVKIEGAFGYKTEGRLTRLESGLPEVAILSGPELKAPGLTLAVARAPGEGRMLGTETWRWDATLTVRNDAGRQQQYAGEWECGS